MTLISKAYIADRARSSNRPMKCDHLGNFAGFRASSGLASIPACRSKQGGLPRSPQSIVPPRKLMPLRGGLGTNSAAYASISPYQCIMAKTSAITSAYISTSTRMPRLFHSVYMGRREKALSFVTIAVGQYWLIGSSLVF
jgi:hypothetical protein